MKASRASCRDANGSNTKEVPQGSSLSKNAGHCNASPSATGPCSKIWPQQHDHQRCCASPVATSKNMSARCVPWPAPLMTHCGSHSHHHQAVGSLLAVGYRRSRATSARTPRPSTVSSFISAISGRPGPPWALLSAMKSWLGSGCRAASLASLIATSSSAPPPWRAATGWPTRVVLSSWAEPAMGDGNDDQGDKEPGAVASSTSDATRGRPRSLCWQAAFRRSRARPLRRPGSLRGPETTSCSP